MALYIGNQKVCPIVSTKPILESLEITPSTSAQTIVPTGVDGYDVVNVDAVTSAIDSDIQAENIKVGVNILGVVGNYTGSSAVLTTKTITSNGTYNASSDNANGYSSVTVSVSSGGSLEVVPYEISQNKLRKQHITSFSLPSGASDLDNYALYYSFYLSGSLQSVDLSELITISGGYGLGYTFYGCPNLASVDLSSLTTVSGSHSMSYTFYGCQNLASVDLSSLTTISGVNGASSAFYNCKNLTSLDLSGLTIISNSYGLSGTFNSCTNLTSADLSGLITVSGSSGMASVFQGCSSLTSVDLSNLTTASGGSVLSSAFQNCTSLTSVAFPKLEQIGSTSDGSQFGRAFSGSGVTSLTFPELTAIYCTGTSASAGTFYNNTTIQKLYFPKLTTITYGTGATATSQSACKFIFSGCTALTEIHFGAANQSAIEATDGYSTLWGLGAGAATVYFDL